MKNMKLIRGTRISTPSPIGLFGKILKDVPELNVAFQGVRFAHVLLKISTGVFAGAICADVVAICYAPARGFLGPVAWGLYGLGALGFATSLLIAFGPALLRVFHAPELFMQRLDESFQAQGDVVKRLIREHRPAQLEEAARLAKTQIVVFDRLAARRTLIAAAMAGAAAWVTLIDPANPAPPSPPLWKLLPPAIATSAALAAYLHSRVARDLIRIAHVLDEAAAAGIEARSREAFGPRRRDVRFLR